MTTTSFITLLESDDGIAALVSGRIYKSVLPRGYSLPAIAVHRYDGQQDYDLVGPIDVREDKFQADCYGRTADECDAVVNAVRALLVAFTGDLTDGSGTHVQACYLDRDEDLPYLPNADQKSLAERSALGFRFVTNQAA